MNYNDIYKEVKSNLFVKQFIKGYYIPKIDRLSSCKGRRIENMQEVRYKELDSKLPNLTFKRIKLDLYSNYNVYFDSYPYYKLFDETYKSYRTFATKIGFFQPFLKEVLSKTSVYSEVFIHVIPEKMITTGKEFSFENILYYLLRTETFDKEFFSKFHFVFSDVNNTRMFKVDFNDSKFSLIRFRKLCNILYKTSNGIQLDMDEEKELSDHDVNQDILDGIKKPMTASSFKMVTNIDPKPEIANLVKEKIVNGLSLNKKISLDDKDIDLLDKIGNSIDAKSGFSNDLDDLESNLNNDEKFLQYLINLKDNQTTVSEEKVTQLKEKQKKVEIELKKDSKPISINSIINEFDVHTIESEPIKIETLNEEVKNCTLKDIDRNYVKNQKDRDLIRVLSAFNDDPECPIFVTGLSRSDISTELDKKELIKVNYEDGWGNKHIVNIEMPIIYDNSFMYLNDHKVSIGKQLMKLPITKNKPNEVSISTDRNKMFFWRFNQKLSSNSDKLKNFILKDVPNYKGKIQVKLGNCAAVNAKFQTIMEYDEISKYMLNFTYDNNIYFSFNRNTVNAEVAEFLDYAVDDSIPENEYLLGTIKGNSLIFTINPETGLINQYELVLKEAYNLTQVQSFNSIFDLFLNIFKWHEETELYKKLLNQKTSTKFMYVRTKVSGTLIPLAILTGFYFGLENVMIRYGIEYEFSEKKKQLDDNEVSIWSSIKFKDGYLNYKSTPLRNSLLMNGLNDIPFLREIDFAQMNEKEVYIEYFDLRYGKRNLAKGFQNTLNFLLDPKTKEVLEYMKLPTDLLGVLLHCNTMLDNNGFIPANSMQNYRLRSIETVNATLYKVLSEAVREYKDAYKSGYHDRKISLHSPDAVIKELVDSPINEAYSTLSPLLEIERLGSTTYKGIGGTNLKQE